MPKGLARLSIAALSATLTSVSILTSPLANATPAFARSTGAACNKCHTINFPRLTARGERFLRNGFQIRTDQAAELDGPGDAQAKEEKGLEKIANDLWLNDMTNILSLYAEVQGIKKTNKEKTVTIGEVDTVAILGSGTLAKDVPFWMELEYAVAEGAWEADRFFVGNTNIGDSTMVNLRIGSLDPTTWTSFYSTAAGAFKSLVPKLGSSKGSVDGATGFAQVGTGFSPRRAIQYYGYTAQLLWSAAIANTPSNFQETEKRNLDYWASVRYDILKGSSVSALYYDANGLVDTKLWNVAANFRSDAVDFLAQYSKDSGTENNSRKARNGYTLQADVPLVKRWLGIVRWDTTDNGEAINNKEAVVTIGVVFAPLQNFKITTALASERKKAATADVPADAPKINSFNVNLMYAM